MPPDVEKDWGDEHFRAGFFGIDGDSQMGRFEQNIGQRGARLHRWDIGKQVWLLVNL